MAILVWRIEYFRKKWLEARRGEIKAEISKLQAVENVCNESIAREKELIKYMIESGQRHPNCFLVP